MSNRKSVIPTDNEIIMPENEIMVSKTDPRGVITYANSIFCQISGYSASELLGQPHSIIRHPDMPRCIFKYMWSKILAGEEIFAYVKNLSKSGDYYWVLAHVTPTMSTNGEIRGFHSNRRAPSRQALQIVLPLYAELLNEERAHADSRKSLEKSYDQLQKKIQESNMEYGEMIFHLNKKQATLSMHN